MQSNIHVVVVSSDGWAWALAWLQLGMTKVLCYPTSDTAKDQLRQWRSLYHFKSVIESVTSVESVISTIQDKITIVCTHVSSPTSLSLFSDLIDACSDISKKCLSIITVCIISKLREQIEASVRRSYSWQILRHATIGGLTTSRVWFGWSGLSLPSNPGSIKYPKRPLDRFLESAVRNQTWRPVNLGTADCWRPSGCDAKPYPWPWRNAPLWVETYSVFQKMNVERLLTTKETCQLLDLRHDWIDLIPHMKEWNDGYAPPLRLFVEFVLSIQVVLQRERIDLGTIGSERRDLKKHFDWGRVRAPWLGGSDQPTQCRLERMLYFGWTWEPTDFLSISVACKGDDAQVNLKLWAVGGDSPILEEARSKIRSWLWKYWNRKISKEAIRWFNDNAFDKPTRLRIQNALIDCLERCHGSDWWNWDSGSRLFFWRWPDIWQAEARDGSPGFHIKQPRPQLRFGQIPIEEEWVRLKDLEKLEKLIRRRYIVEGPCRTTVPRFPVPKGSDDIRVVWDLSKNGVNETMFTPTFFLATMASYLRRIDVGFYGGDFDVGEQFHNYVLHESEQTYCGVEIPLELRTKLSQEGLLVPKYMRWARLVFGWQSSPYLALRMFARVIELAKGHPKEPNSAFQWDKVELNLPGSAQYNPAKPRVMRINSFGKLAADVVTFYDDGRVFAATEEDAIRALRQITARIQYYGNQDAARKRRAVSQRPGAWAGGVAYTDQGILRKFISQEKWDKTKLFLTWVWEQLMDNDGSLDRAKFCSGKGFLVHISLCYDFMVPYMKGFHLSENSWREQRDAEGWKIDRPQEIAFDATDSDESFDDDNTWFSLFDHPQPNLDKQANPPPFVKAVPRLQEDVRVLRLFFDPPTPLQVIVRPVEGANLVAYGAGDASGEGFGGQILPIGMKPLLRRGFWCLADSENSSNWRELRNLVDTIRKESDSGRLVGREVWIATDNSTAANAFYRGTSTSKLLHDMITELRLLTLEGNFILHIFHISGTRMIESGIDGLSRGELHLAALESSIESLMPLHRSALDRSPILINWLNSWLDPDFAVCKPEDWFYNAHQAGDYDHAAQSKTWVWDLPPAAAIHAIEELGFARLKRHNILRGVVVIPFLLSNEWFRRFSKTVDVYFTVPADINPGIGSMSLLWYRLEARCQRCTKKVTHLQGLFCANFGEQAPGLPPCQRAWCAPCYKTLPGADFLIYRPVDDDGEELCAHGEERDFLEARDGDHLVCPFECDYCAFYRLRGHLPLPSSNTDQLLLTYIRHANLDAFWARRPGTIYGLNRLFKEQVEVGELFGFTMLDRLGPFSRNYDSGMKAAIGILWRSQRRGNHETKMKFSSARKARALHTDFYNASARGVEGTMVWRSDRARFVATKASTDSAWFNSFMTGFKARIGERRKQDAAIPIQVMLAIQESLETDWQELTVMGSQAELRDLVLHGAFYLFLYCGSLRGFEGPKVSLSDLRRQIAAPGSPLALQYGPHIGLPLVGRFKARSQDSRNIIIPIAYTTASNLQPGVWAERLIRVLETDGVTTGWAFQDSHGDQLPMSYFEDDFYDRLTRIHQNQPNMFTDGINILEDFHIARSFRRGATTRATAAGVAASDIDWINRWNIGADASGSGPMRVLYSDRVQLTELFLRFSLAL